MDGWVVICLPQRGPEASPAHNEELKLSAREAGGVMLGQASAGL